MTPDAPGVVAAAVDAERTGHRVFRIGRPEAPDQDPFVLAAAAAAATTAIGLVVVVPTDRWHPYLIARRLAALDKISGGRIAWEPRDPDAARRAEAEQIVDGLLSSWRPGAVVNDRENGVHVDTDLVVPVRFSGAYFHVDSPLDVCPGPQGVVRRTREVSRAR